MALQQFYDNTLSYNKMKKMKQKKIPCFVTQTFPGIRAKSFTKVNSCRPHPQCLAFYPF